MLLIYPTHSNSGAGNLQISKIGNRKKNRNRKSEIEKSEIENIKSKIGNRKHY